MSERSLTEREILALFQMYDHRPAGREHDQMRQAYYDAVQNVLGCSWFGRVRVYLTKRCWCIIQSGADTGFWVEHENQRVRVGDCLLRHTEKCGHVTILSEGNFADVVYILSSGFEYAEGIMRLPVGETPAEFTPEVER